jgi:RNA polymerase sigma-70 factor, ECF subfamily
VPDPRPDSAETVRLLERAALGDQAAVGDLFARHRDGLRNFVTGRLDPAVRARVDPSDVVQEALAEAARRLPDYLARRPMPFHLWARKAAYEHALKARRAHRAECRNVGREAAARDQSSLALIHSLAGNGPTPSEAAAGAEAASRVARALDDLNESDREILLLRQVDQLPYEEIGPLLDIDPAAARQRYGRALIRLERALAAHGVTRSH